MCACVRARMLLVEVVTHHTCSNTSPGSSSLPSGANPTQMETLHWKTVTFLPMKPTSEEAGVMTPPSTGQEGTGQNGSLPLNWHGYCSREWPAVEFKCKETLFSPLQTPLYTPGHSSMTPTALGQPSGAGDCQARQGAVCPASRPAPRPAPSGCRGLATLLLEAREWGRTLLDSAPGSQQCPGPAPGSTSVANLGGPGELHRWHQ